MADGVRTVIFLHIPKTGGGSLRRMITAHHGDAVYDAAAGPDEREYLRFLREETGAFNVTVDDNTAALAPWQARSAAERARTRLFMGHFWFGVHALVPGPARYMTIVRDPVDRVLARHTDLVQREGLRIPLERYVQTERDWHISDAQTRLLATSGLGEHIGDVTETMFDVACERLVERFAVVGTTERYDETVVAVARALNWRSIDGTALARAPGRPSRAAVPGAVVERLQARNQFDARLHQVASDHLDKKLAGLDVPAELHRLEPVNRLVDYRRQAHAAYVDVKALGSRMTRAARQRFAR